MTAGPKKKSTLGINDKDYEYGDSSGITEDDFRRNWVSKNEFSARNCHPDVFSNQEDHGFNHLGLTLSADHAMQDASYPNLSFANDEEQAQYLSVVRNKLALTKHYILKEEELGLDPDRPNVHKTPTALALEEGPVKIGVSDQQLVRLILVESKRLRALVKAKEDVELELNKSQLDYWTFWTRFQASLAVQVPGKTQQEKEAGADKVMKEVLEKLVQIDTAEG